MAGFLVHIYHYARVSLSGLRLAEIDDLDVENWTLVVKNPKGKKRYAMSRTVKILPPARDATLKFLEKRKKWLTWRGHGEVKPLVPRIHGKVGFYSDKQFRAIKKRIQEKAGIAFALKDFRSTFTQLTLDRNPNLLPDVSKQLGHASTVTTERYYGRIRDHAAFRRLEEAWSSPKEEQHVWVG